MVFNLQHSEAISLKFQHGFHIFQIFPPFCSEVASLRPKFAINTNLSRERKIRLATSIFLNKFTPSHEYNSACSF